MLEDKQSDAYHTLFIKQKLEKFIALIVYVDDMVVTGNYASELTALQRKLAAEFELKDLGNLKYWCKYYLRILELNFNKF